MTSIPASRSAAAMTFAPRSWPSRPTFAINTRIFLFIVCAGNPSLRQKLFQCYVKLRQRKTDDRVEASLNPLNEDRAVIVLDSVCTGLIHRRTGPDVLRNFRISELAEFHLRHLNAGDLPVRGAVDESESGV